LCNQKNLGEMIVNSRRFHGLSQESLARRLGVDPSTLANWERDKRRPSRRYLERLKVFFGESIT
jgi:transcriptional regulator with XRE-family HTH domain